jgi:hypothetical protein
MKHEYAGIAGAYPDPAGRGSGVCRDEGGQGWICRNGLLPMNESRNIARAIDGTSNTIIVGEQSGRVGVTDSVQSGVVQYPIAANYCGGWAGVHTGKRANELTSADNRFGYYIGLTTVRWQLNASTAVVNSSDLTYHTNTVLNSMHPTIVQVLLGDGSARALAENIDMATLRRLCVADDGLLIEEF